MSKGRPGKMPGIGGSRAHLSRRRLRGGGGGGPHGVGGSPDAQAQSRKRELLRRMRESEQTVPEPQGREDAAGEADERDRPPAGAPDGRSGEHG
jgi:hypothetical protein